MKFFKSIFLGIIISGVLILNAADVYAALNNRNVWTGFFHQKGSPSSVSIKKSFSAAFKKYLDSGKPYFVFAYTLLKKPPYFNFDKKINLVRIKKLGLAYHSNYIITGSISRLGSNFTVHAMLIDVADVYKSKTLNYSGAGIASLKKELNRFSNKVGDFIYGRIAKKIEGNQNSSLEKKIYAVRVKGNIRVGAGFIMNRIKIKPGSYYSINKINESVKDLYKTGYFKNILVDITSSGGR